MLVITKNRIPIKSWAKDLEKEALEQANNLANLPFAFKHIALMPDCHVGYGMPIGGVMATEGVIVPNAVGVDIGCGVAFFQTNIPADLLRNTNTGSGNLLQSLIGDISRNIPSGFKHHKKPQPCKALDSLHIDDHFRRAKALLKEIDRGYYQVGTLGGGNHFIEIQANEADLIGVMIHSGSRNFGYKICQHFNQVARKRNKQENSPVPSNWQLAYLPVDSPEGRAYIQWMNLALDFARENREAMISKVKEIVWDRVMHYTGFKEIEIAMEVNAHHNYAALEKHFKRKVWVHRKGAIRAGAGELGIVPGSMGADSYLVRGLGNEDSFMSCSHGAGRVMGRKQAKRELNPHQVATLLKERGVVFSGKISDIIDEAPQAYKDIQAVMAAQADLVEPVVRLRGLAVVKAAD
ncbi:MAG: RtcB family protein [Syntrophomonadaceae bacterium]|nr:RtcB family protein [Syntrophomonadaceae bacterium]